MTVFWREQRGGGSTVWGWDNTFNNCLRITWQRIMTMQAITMADSHKQTKKLFAIKQTVPPKRPIWNWMREYELFAFQVSFWSHVYFKRQSFCFELCLFQVTQKVNTNFVNILLISFNLPSHYKACISIQFQISWHWVSNTFQSWLCTSVKHAWHGLSCVDTTKYK